MPPFKKNTGTTSSGQQNSTSGGAPAGAWVKPGKRGYAILPDDLSPEQLARLAKEGFEQTGGPNSPNRGGTVRPTRPQAPKPPKPAGGGWVPGEYDTTDDGGNFGGAQGWRNPPGWDDPAPTPPTTAQPTPRWEFDPMKPTLPPAGEGSGPGGTIAPGDIARAREFGWGPQLPPKPKPRKPKKPTKPHRPSRGSINPGSGGAYLPH